MSRENEPQCSAVRQLTAERDEALRVARIANAACAGWKRQCKEENMTASRELIYLSGRVTELKTALRSIAGKTTDGPSPHAALQDAIDIAKAALSHLSPHRRKT